MAACSTRRPPPSKKHNVLFTYGSTTVSQVGKVEEIFGGVSNAYFTIKMGDGIVATSYKAGDKFYIDPMKLLPLERFLPQPKGASGRGGGRGEHFAMLEAHDEFLGNHICGRLAAADAVDALAGRVEAAKIVLRSIFCQDSCSASTMPRCLPCSCKAGVSETQHTITH